MTYSTFDPERAASIAVKWLHSRLWVTIEDRQSRRILTERDIPASKQSDVVKVLQTISREVHPRLAMFHVKRPRGSAVSQRSHLGNMTCGPRR